MDRLGHGAEVLRRQGEGAGAAGGLAADVEEVHAAAGRGVEDPVARAAPDVAPLRDHTSADAAQREPWIAQRKLRQVELVLLPGDEVDGVPVRAVLRRAA